MKIIHSFWSRPAFHEQQGYANARALGGWINERYLFLSSAYSCLRAKQHHPNVELYTDMPGREILIDVLHLPYDHVSTALDNLAQSNHRLWVLGKFVALQHQATPFLHIDNDVYLWQTLPVYARADFLLAQSLIPLPPEYRTTLVEVLEHFDFVPACIRARGIPEALFVANAGVIGGNDIDFFDEYCSLADEFLRRNHHCLSKVNVGYFNTILDEYLFTCLAGDRGKSISYLVDAPAHDPFKEVTRFHLVPFIDKYVHLVGYAKRNQYACDHLALRFSYEFPQEYRSIDRTLSDLFPSAFTPQKENRQKMDRISKCLPHFYNCLPGEILNKKMRLADGYAIHEYANDGDETYCLSAADQEMQPLVGMDETLVYFRAPVCINDLIEELKRERVIADEATLETYTFKLVDFAVEKMLLEGLLQFQ